MPAAAHAAYVLLTEQPALTGPYQRWVGAGLAVQPRGERGDLATLIDGSARHCVGWAVGKDNDTG